MALKFKCWQRTKSIHVIDSFSPSQNGCNTMSWGVLLYRCYLYRAMLVNMFLYLCFRKYQVCQSSWSSASDSYGRSRRGSSWWASRHSCKPTPTPPENIALHILYHKFLYLSHRLQNLWPGQSARGDLQGLARATSRPAARACKSAILSVFIGPR